ncbi:MAG: anthranilate phosphoribosyltransferase, partial [Candidatus Syntrophonatronum acetioxidans]
MLSQLADVKSYIDRVVKGKDLSIEESRKIMDLIMSGGATEAQIASFLTALRMKGETVEEITGCARVMREKVTRIEVNCKDMVDTCGTGGDQAGTFNISTTAAFVAAGSGLKVAKHGNRSVSSRCGSADLLEALGINLDISPLEAAASIEQVGIGFLFAPSLHLAMKHAIKPRRDIGLRTIFNLLGPLTNPAGASRQV